jgi:hypothetical protein
MAYPLGIISTNDFMLGEQLNHLKKGPVPEQGTGRGSKKKLYRQSMSDCQ